MKSFLLYLLPFYLIAGIKLIAPELFSYSSFLSSYLLDVAALPVYLSLVVLIRRFLFIKRPKYVVSKTNIIGAVLLVTIIFEVVLPLNHARYVADPIDGLAYVFGATLYFLIQRSTLERQSK